MLKSIQQRDLERNRWVKIGMSVLLGVICLSMLTYLIPGMGSAALTNSPDAVATWVDKTSPPPMCSAS